MATIYSYQFLNLHDFSPGTYDWIVPGPSDVALVKHATFINDTTGPSSFAELNGFKLYVYSSGAPIFVKPRCVFGRNYDWDGRVVLGAGDGIVVQASTPGWSVIVSGFLFSS